MRPVVFLFIIVNGSEADENAQESQWVQYPMKCDLMLVLEWAEQWAFFWEHQNWLKLEANVADSHQKRVPWEQGFVMGEKNKFNPFSYCY
jgi:hypothetical protein